MKKIALAILALMLTATPVYADDFLDLFEDGQRQAFEKWKPLAEQGDAEAQFHLGEKYDTGLGVTQDDKEAVKWYRLSAEQGYAKAQYSLGVMYNNGQGISQDYKEAVNWYRKAADQGLANAQYNLGWMYNNGQGISQDYKEAVNWYRKAADQGLANAQYSLGWMYADGWGVPQDYVQAHKWYNIAGANGYADGRKNRDLVGKKMTTAQIAQAQEMTRQWLVNNQNKGKEPGPQTVPGEKPSIMIAGTGFSFGSSGYILTNYHLVNGAKRIKVRFLNGDVSTAKITVKDESSDIAFLKPEYSPKQPGVNISLGDSSEMRIGDKVFTIGFPMSNILGQQPGYSEGVINSLTGVGDSPKAFRISVPIQSGNSGGPLFNEKGEVVGIVSSSLNSDNTFQVFGNTPQNVNFAVKSAFIKNLLPMIPETLISPTGIVVVPKDSGSLSGFIERVQNNIVLIESEY